MSHRLLKALGGTTSIVLAATMLHVAPSAARSAPAEPAAAPTPIVVTAKANGPNHFNSSVTVDVPLGGTAQITSPSLDPSMTKAKIELTAPLSDQPGFELMATALVQQPTRVGRFVMCLIITQDQLSDDLTDAAADSSSDYAADAPSLLLVRLVMCLRISELIAQLQAGGRSGRLASTSCGQGQVGLKEKVSQSGGTYHLTVKGAPNTKSKNAKVKIKCKVVSPTRTVMTIRPKKKGQTLRSVLGENIGLGLASPSSAPQGAQVKVAFKAP